MPTWSDDSATLASLEDWDQFQEDMETMLRVVSKEKQSKDIVVVAIVPEVMVKKLKALTKKRWWQFWKDGSAILVTTAINLQFTLQRRFKPKRRSHLALIASPRIDEIAFSVHHPIKSIELLRAGHDGDPHGTLFVDGSSRFGGRRLDQWHRRGLARSRSVFIGHGVAIRYRYGLGSDASSISTKSSSVSDRDSQRIQRQLQQMRNTGTQNDWWNNWRGPIAIILGILVGGTKLLVGVKTSATGCFFSLKYGSASLAAGGFKATATAIATAAGPAVLLGAATALGVYFIDWDYVFSGLKRLYPSLSAWLTNWWSWFKGWLTSYFVPHLRNFHETRPRPMHF